MLENQFDFFGIFVQHLLEQRLEPRTVESLIVAEDGKSYWRILRPLKW